MEKQQNTKISIIVPIYNTEDYLPRCLDSLLAQTLTDLEILCVDDGSTDSTPEILRRYAEADPRVHVFHQENKRQGAARNLALAHVHGDYISFVDSDDRLAPDALEALYTRAVENRLDILFFGGETEYESEALRLNHDAYFDRAYRRDKTTAEICPGPEMLRNQREAGQFWRTACMALIRTVFLQENGIRFREDIRYEDNLFIFELCLKAKRCASVPDPFYRRLLRGESTMTQHLTHRNLAGYASTIFGEIRLLENLSPDDPNRSAFVSLVDATRASAYGVWEKLDSSEKEKAVNELPAGTLRVSEQGLYETLLRPALSRQEAMEGRIAEQKQHRAALEEEIRELRRVIEELRSSPVYRLGRALMKPLRLLKKQKS